MIASPDTVEATGEDVLFAGATVRVRCDGEAWYVERIVREGVKTLAPAIDDGPVRLVCVDPLTTPCRAASLVLLDAHREGDALVGEVAGHWDLSGSWRLLGSASWPFGEIRHADVAAFERAPLVALRDDGALVVPTIPSFSEAEAWVLGKGLVAGPTSCNCGAIHHEGGPVVGLTVEEWFEGARSARLVVRDAEGRHAERLVESHLPLREAVLLGLVECGGVPVSKRNASRVA